MAEYRVANLSELQDTGRKIVRVGTTDVALLMFQGEVIAFENRCLHQGGPVGEGMLINKVVADIDDEGRFRGERFDEDEVHLVCPWHGWEYVLPSGVCAAMPRRKLRAVQVDVRDDQVFLELAESVTERAVEHGRGG